MAFKLGKDYCIQKREKCRKNRHWIFLITMVWVEISWLYIGVKAIASSRKTVAFHIFPGDNKEPKLSLDVGQEKWVTDARQPKGHREYAVLLRCFKGICHMIFSTDDDIF